MPTICDWVPSVYQCAQLLKEVVCMRAHYCTDRDKLKVSHLGVVAL